MPVFSCRQTDDIKANNAVKTVGPMSKQSFFLLNEVRDAFD